MTIRHHAYVAPSRPAPPLLPCVISVSARTIAGHRCPKQLEDAANATHILICYTIPALTPRKPSPNIAHPAQHCDILLGCVTPSLLRVLAQAGGHQSAR